MEGTKFYRITLEELIDYWWRRNKILYQALVTYGMDAIDLSLLFGSGIDYSARDSVLYVCETDGLEVEINGNLVDPETIWRDYGFEGIENLISYEDLTSDKLGRLVTDMNFDYDLINKNIKNLIIELLESDDASFVELIDAWADIENN